MADDPRPSPPRFSLAGLLELIAGVGLFLALVTQLEWQAAVLLAVIGWLIAGSVHGGCCPATAAAQCGGLCPSWS